MLNEPTTTLPPAARSSTWPGPRPGICGLHDRGRLVPGLAADICVLAPGGLAERATDETPTAPAAGVDLVFANGTIAGRDGAPVPGARSGRVVG